MGGTVEGMPDEILVIGGYRVPDSTWKERKVGSPRSKFVKCGS